MLEKIKSLFIIQKFFSNIDERKKLKLIKYNKTLQTRINICILNYKIFSKKYIIYGEDEKGKEYDEYNRLIFEGEFYKGERNGKGKEYGYEGNLTFEGEYLNGKKNGKGKEYDYEGNLIFEGEYLNGKRWKGKGKEYYDTQFFGN